MKMTRKGHELFRKGSIIMKRSGSVYGRAFECIAMASGGISPDFLSRIKISQCGRVKREYIDSCLGT